MSANRWANPINNNILRDLQDNVLASGSIEVFEAGTSTPIAVYSDPDLTTPIGSYLDADAYGLIPDFHLPASTQVKVVAYDAIGGSAGAGATKWTRDYIFNIDNTIDTRLDALEASIGSIQAGYGNAVINGGMRVLSVTGPATMTTAYLEGGVAGVYGKVASVTAGTLKQTADSTFSTGFVAHFSGISTATSNDTVDCQIRVHSKDSTRFLDGAATFTCYVYHDVGVAVDYTINAGEAIGVDDFSSVSSIFTGATASVADATRTKLTLSVPDMGDCSNGIAITISAACGAVATKQFKIGEAQLEQGATATEFSEPLYQVANTALKFATPTYQLDGLNMVRSAAAKVTVGAGSANSSDGSANLTLTAALIKNIKANWAVGDDTGGFPSGLTIATATWYRVFLIAKTDGTTDAGFDTSATAANLLADATGYTLYRRVGWVLTDGSSDIVDFIQDGDRFDWVTLTSASASISATAASVTAIAPPSSIASVTLLFNDPNEVYGLATSLDQTNSTPSTYLCNFSCDASSGQFGSGTSNLDIPLNASSQLRVRATEVLSNFYIMSNGWTDTRGKL